LHATANGRKIRGRTDSLSARWTDLRPAVQDFKLAKVTLRGAIRTIEVGAESDANVRADVETISDSLDDTFFVPSASVRAIEETSEAVIEADFTRMVASTRDDASLNSMAKVAIRVLGHRYPPENAEFEKYLP
jgi:hypothetical protein